MHVLIAAEDSADPLQEELTRAFPDSSSGPLPGNLVLAEGLPAADVALPPFVFARQLLTDARPAAAPSIREFANLLLVTIDTAVPADQPWRLHIVPQYGGSTAGVHRCELIGEALRDRLQRQRRRLLRQFQSTTSPFTSADSLVQLLLTAPDQGFLSVAGAPIPHRQRAVLSPYPGGEVPVASDKAAPSRAFAKLLEAELRLGVSILPGETCVDLGASPGSWTYVALNRGARVLAVDRSPLRDDLMRHPRLTFHRGDAFRFEPAEPVDWLLCDVIAAPERSIQLVLDWVRRRRCRRFVVTIKFKGTDEYALLDQLKTGLPGLTETFLLTRLCANKNEACVAGVVRADTSVR